tara:strand:- start:286 stop:444 length:159 start_codon:yes stop_codon:yes gene_type:complete
MRHIVLPAFVGKQADIPAYRTGRDFKEQFFATFKIIIGIKTAPLKIQNQRYK